MRFLKKLRKGLWRALQIALAALLLWVIVLGVQVVHFGNQNTDVHADAAVVLGAAVYRNRPSPVFRERINHAIKLYQEGQVDALIFTGGLGGGDQITEGEAARQYALAAGVPDEDIHIEITSKNTYENLSNAQQIMAYQGFATVLVVSDPLHMRRAMLYAEDLGIDAYSSPTTTTRYQSFQPKFNFLAREVYFLVLFRLFPDIV